MPNFIETTDAAGNGSTTYTLQTRQTAQGTLSAGDHDWYRVDLVAGQTYSFAMVGTGRFNVQNTYLRLYAADGSTLVASADDGLTGQNSFFTFTATTSGTFYLDAASASASGTGQYGVSFTDGARPFFDTQMGGGAVDTELAWGAAGAPVVVTYAFRETPGAYAPASPTQLTTAQMDAVRQALGMWSAVCNVTFQEVNPGGYSDNAAILFGAYNNPSDGAGAFANYPYSADPASPSGDIWLNLSSISTTSLPIGGYAFHAIMHELGHALGLSHPGLYNAAPGVSITYAANAQFVQDTRQYTVMSYFGETYTGASFGPSYEDGLMLFDIFQAQQLYGANMSTRAGDTVYGFNSNAGSIYDFTTNASPAFCIWDGGGNDTLDVSRFGQTQRIDLNSEAFSNIGGLTSNISIAYGATIENAVGGLGDDTIIGNQANNRLSGGMGADTMSGGLGDDTFVADDLATSRASTLDSNALVASGELPIYRSYTQPSGVMSYFSNFTTAGYTYQNLSQQPFAFWTHDASYGSGYYIYDGPNVINVANAAGTSNASDTIRVSGGVFSAASIALDASIAGRAGVIVTFTGGRADGTTTTQAFTLDNLNGLQTFAFNSTFTSLTSLTISATSFFQFNALSLVKAPGDDSIDGGVGSDTIDYSATTQGVVINLAASSNQASGAEIGADQLASVENAIGGSGADLFIGTSGANRFDGGAGVDTIDYSAATQTIYVDFTAALGVGSGVDIGVDQLLNIENIIAGAGADTLVGNASANRILGGAGNDVIFGADGADTLIGGSHAAGGFNQLWGGAGADTADYSAETGRVYVDLRSPAGYVDTGAGYVLNDLMNAIENAVGGSGDDMLVGTDADANVLDGGAGADALFGFGGDDTLAGGAHGAGQYNQLYGGAGSDTASYAWATTRVYADLNVYAGWVADGGGALVLNDVYNLVENLTGGAAGDSLVGDAGANVLTGSGGADILYANTGAGFDASIDTFVYRNASESNLAAYDTIVNFETGRDRLDFSAFGITAANVSIASGGGSTSVYANVDGVAGNDLAIVVIGANAVAMGDIRFA